MANNVFANGREISCKKADGKSICAFPDVCMTPPENPATPPGVPIPYPNTGFAKDTTSGSKKVKISNKEVMLKNKSYFKKSMGDEAGSAAKKGVITSTNRGKVYFTMWSMDVKVESQNVVRHLDLTTHNHMCLPGNTGPWPYLDSMFLAAIKAWSEAQPKCECCGGMAHSAAQARGEEISEDEFYNPSQTGPSATKRRGHSNLSKSEARQAEFSKFVIDYIRETGECEELLPAAKSDDPCAKYYRNTSAENKVAREQFDDLKNPSSPNFRPELKKKGVGHRVPLSAGGCPVGSGNLQSVPDGCESIESDLGQIQGQMATVGR